MKLAASVIVRDELDRYLAPCIEHLLSFCDEIRILDDGSSDGWEETLRPAWGDDGRRVIVHRHEVDSRDERGSFHLHAAARSRLREFTLEGRPDWVLAVDADELVTDGAILRAACEKRPASALSTVITEVWEACPGTLCAREDGGWRARPIANVWQPVALRGRSLTLQDKGTATGRVPDQVNRVPSRPSGAATLHFGWSCEADRAERFKRYTRPGEGHASAHVASIMWPADRVTLEPLPWPPSWPADLRDRVRERANRGHE